MSVTYVNDLRLSEMSTGSNSGTWGNVTNTNLELIGDALGYGTEAIDTNADTHSSTIADGTADAARAMYIKYTGTLDSACTITIGPNTISRVHIIENATSGSQNIIIKQGSGATVTIESGAVKMVYLDGAGSGAAVTDALVDLSLAGNTTITTTDNSDNLTLICTDADASSGPNLNMFRNSASPANNDFLGNIKFNGRNDNSQDVQYAELEIYAIDVADGSEDGLFNVNVITGGSNLSYLQMKGGTGVTFNEDSNDIDFRIESNNSEKMFVVDAGSDFVSISGANGLSEVLNGGTASVNSVSSNAALEINTRSATNGHSGIINFIKAPNTSGTPTATADGEYLGRASFIGADTGNTLRVGAQILAVQSGTDSDSVPTRLILNTSSGSSDPVSRFEISTAETIVNEDSNDVDFRIESDVQANTFFVEGSSGNVSVGSGTPVPSASNYNTACLHIRQTGSSNVGSQLRLTTGETGHTASDGSFIAQWEDLNMYMTNQENAGWRFFGNGDELLTLSPTSANFNDSSNNIDFRVESDNYANMFVVADDNVLINKSAVSFGSPGAEFHPLGSHNMTRDGNPPLALNRTSSDGQVLVFYKDSAAVGSINMSGGDLVIGSNASNHGGLRFGEGYIFPVDNSGSTSDGVFNLGIDASTARFKDGFFSGNVDCAEITYDKANSSAGNSGLNVSAQYSYDDNNTNTIGSLFHNNHTFIYINTNAGFTVVPVLSNGGSGVAWANYLWDPDNQTWSSANDMTFTQSGTSGNTFRIQINAGTGAGTIERTSGSMAYQVYISRPAGGAVKMSVTFNMDISRAKSTNINGMNNIVKQVRLSITATDGVNTAVSFFPVDLDYPDKENFIEYEKLTRDQISTWVMNKVGEDQINSLKNGLTSELKDKAVEDPDNPVLTNIQLPN